MDQPQIKNIMNHQTGRLTAYIVLLLVTALPLAAQPKMKIVEGTKLDYGTIYSNELMRHELTVKNEGKDTLSVSDISSSCGCTVAMVSKNHIPPKGEGKISISFDPSRFSGTVSKAISFETNDPANPHGHVEFTVNVSKVIEVSEDYITFPGAVVDSTTEVVYGLKNVTDRPIRILSILSTSPIVSAESDTKIIAPQQAAKITASLRSSEKGIFKGNIKIDTDNPNVAHISTRFFALVKSKASSTPSVHK